MHTTGKKDTTCLHGSCLCGQVPYAISGGLGDIVHCHCQTCRKAHGAAFSNVASVPVEYFALIRRDCGGNLSHRVRHH